MARTTSLIPEQRRQQILRHLRAEEVLSYRQITELLGVSQMTARRDVAALAEQGRLRATQGGAAAIARLDAEPSRADKAVAELPQKSAIARAAADLVSDSMTVYLDAGTTVQAVRPHLEHRRDLTIVSNDLGTLLSFLDHPSADLICVGGRIDRDNQSMIGRLATITLSELSLDLALLSSSSWDVRHGVTTPVEAKIDPKRAALASATSVALLADSGKFGRYAKYRVLGLDEVDTVITDAGLPVADADRIEALGTEVVRAALAPEARDAARSQASRDAAAG
ncbi:DeoR/GlpR family DNA-binding transcription regulator [Microbacterium marinilacus]|uniref:DeoR/GlpR family DNA-binding transcription regulator n=1 Tax=Microbacterium marinilacus TaxID=415209 RepID=A0ABP7BHN6_9MICO|nr:DeoR/GlpR family DNA-binding transcription regulator [Microbacterium marinilacus]MBY0690319.1 DeoR/GlpR family DNA-binding transcription regulator [Microbacterium marinilacus]